MRGGGLRRERERPGGVGGREGQGCGEREGWRSEERGLRSEEMLSGRIQY